MVVRPSGILANTNISIRDTPVTISGMVMGMFEMALSRLNQPFFMEYMPMAARVPTMTDTRVAITATDRVTFRAEMMLSFWKSFTYQSRVKPAHSARDSLALKERPNITRMGRYKKASTRMRYRLLTAFTGPWLLRIMRALLSVRDSWTGAAGW